MVEWNWWQPSCWGSWGYWIYRLNWLRNSQVQTHIQPWWRQRWRLWVCDQQETRVPWVLSCGEMLRWDMSHEWNRIWDLNAKDMFEQDGWQPSRWEWWRCWGYILDLNLLLERSIPTWLQISTYPTRESGELRADIKLSRSWLTVAEIKRTEQNMLTNAWYLHWFPFLSSSG